MVTMLLLTLALLLAWSERAPGGDSAVRGAGKMPGFYAAWSSARKCLEVQERVGAVSCLRILPPSPVGLRKNTGLSQPSMPLSEDEHRCSPGALSRDGSVRTGQSLGLFYAPGNRPTEYILRESKPSGLLALWSFPGFLSRPFAKTAVTTMH